MATHNRRFAGASDIAPLVDWVRALRPPQRMTDYPSPIDLPQLLSQPHNQEATRLWIDGSGELLGYAFVDVFRTLRFELDWQQATPALEAEIVMWGDECLTKTLAAEQPSQLFATAHEADSVRLAYLDRQGFTRLADQVVHLERALAAPIETRQLPAGFSIRQVEGEHEAAEIATLHREAFGTPHMTTERRLALMRTAHYDPTLDLVAVAPEGARAAYGMGSINPEENILTGRNACYTDLFATHPAYRGRGLARALLAALLRLVNTRGYDTAKLNTSSENMPMQQVALSEGFQIISRTLRFARPCASSASDEG
jgi:ribosomal protein S18 acetylase RimI-like enzyme